MPVIPLDDPTPLPPASVPQPVPVDNFTALGLRTVGQTSALFTIGVVLTLLCFTSIIGIPLMIWAAMAETQLRNHYAGR